MFTSTITIEGRLAQDATAVSESLTELVVLTNRRAKDGDGEWANTDTSRYVVKAFRSKAKKAAELEQGTQVVIAGSIVTDSWESADGNRYQQVVHADAIGISL